MTNNRPKTALKPFIAIVADGAPLTREQAGEAFDIIMSGDATDAQVAGFLMALRVRGETLDEIVGAVSAMRARMIAVKAPDGAMDIVGTGGDGLGTYNISTASAFVAAGAGVPVAKHGNKAVSSHRARRMYSTSSGSISWPISTRSNGPSPKPKSVF